MRVALFAALLIALVGCSSAEPEQESRSPDPALMLTTKGMQDRVDSIKDPCIRGHAERVLRDKFRYDLITSQTIDELVALDRCQEKKAKEDEEVDE